MAYEPGRRPALQAAMATFGIKGEFEDEDENEDDGVIWVWVNWRGGR